MLFSKKPEAVAVDIGSHSIKLVQLKRSAKGYQLKHFGIIPLPPDVFSEGEVADSEAIVSALKNLLENEKLLFTGDHIMQGSTVVIDPPDGDMSVYMASLRLLQREDLAHFAPGHGFLMDKTQEVVERLLIHRMERENKVYAALRGLGSATVEALLPAVYDDVPARMHPVASRSLLAHLIKLGAEGRVTRTGEYWSL